MSFVNDFNNCRICPRNCSVNRNIGKLGYCNSDSNLNIASIIVHKGEEPVISGEKGICNIFFSKCNMQCIYCQNIQISSNKNCISKSIYTIEKVVEKIIDIFTKNNINSLGFVTPNHYHPYVIEIIKMLRKEGFNPITVYNTNAYEKVERIKELESYISVYLPDFKYYDNNLAFYLSDTSDYFEIASKAIKEMYRQKGATLIINDDGICESGLIIRHLVIPNSIENSLKVLEWIAYELSSSVSVSLMSQYYPIKIFSDHKFLNNKLSQVEYTKVVDKMETLYLYNGWIQELESSENYIPDFENDNPFEKKD